MVWSEKPSSSRNACGGLVALRSGVRGGRGPPSRTSQSRRRFRRSGQRARQPYNYVGKHQSLSTYTIVSLSEPAVPNRFT